MDRRLPGELTSEQLTQANTHMRDYMATRCNAGTVNDKDNGLPVSIALSSPVCLSSTAGNTAAKTATVENFADFELQSGMEITVYFENANTASEPTLNVEGTGAFPITVAGQGANIKLGSGCLDAGFYDFKYIDITVNGTRLQQWMIKNSNVVEKTNDYIKYGDGTIVYNSTRTPIVAKRVSIDGEYNVEYTIDITDLEINATYLINSASAYAQQGSICGILHRGNGTVQFDLIAQSYIDLSATRDDITVKSTYPYSSSVGFHLNFVKIS